MCVCACMCVGYTYSAAIFLESEESKILCSQTKFKHWFQKEGITHLYFLFVGGMKGEIQNLIQCGLNYHLILKVFVLSYWL